jgi:hypothetical protein
MEKDEIEFSEQVNNTLTEFCEYALLGPFYTILKNRPDSSKEFYCSLLTDACELTEGDFLGKYSLYNPQYQGEDAKKLPDDVYDFFKMVNLITNAQIYGNFFADDNKVFHQHPFSMLYEGQLMAAIEEDELPEYVMAMQKNISSEILELLLKGNVKQLLNKEGKFNEGDNADEFKDSISDIILSYLPKESFVESLESSRKKEEGKDKSIA